MSNLIQFFEDSVKQFGSRPFLWDKRDAIFQSISYNETLEKVELLANGFLANQLQYSDRVALMSEGRPYWLISELAVLYCGAINVPLSTKLEADNDLVFRLNHSECRFAVVSSTQLEKIRLIKQNLTSLVL